IEADLPARRPEPGHAPPAVVEALGLPGRAVRQAAVSRSALLLELDSETRVAEVRPDFDALRRADADKVIVTALATGEGDFVSRVFAPRVGVDEDAVTGSAHCLLGPYWAPRLERPELVGRQLSPRGGRVLVMVGGDRVILGGTAVTVFRGAFAADSVHAGEPVLAR
ncbi:MAG: PhzF family phenazine biosynthesis protein, partial [Candidatus Dormibacteraeota bacterium]|nr:PhzF family phenazine biosynthesis protein [Candidatus Dormibacteraeota bacterium]